ncbi:MAG: hypothetical protein OEV81_10930 [Betaproteobacteria bacterium]|nr:hypothetical protein [Betaproteobacteria bacterium]MDH5221698.1 hypothetical protein [Betaproteobacteria bacterium]MDH5350853.1 hypothetical protein [Betaproteobacteria bacterium]
MSGVRIALELELGIVAVYAAAVLGAEERLAMAVGLAPLAWLALEGGWRLLAPRH